MGRDRWCGVAVMVAIALATPVLAAGSPALGVGACPAVTAPAVSAKVLSPLITEASGLAASRRQPGLLWTHNDNGGPVVVYGISAADGAVVAVVHLDVRGSNVEEIKLGPGPRGKGSFLYLADTGDNRSQRPEVRLFRFPEPTVALDGFTEMWVNGTDTTRFTYRNPGDPTSTWSRNSEAFVVTRAGDVLVIEKNLDRVGGLRTSWVYRLAREQLFTDGLQVAEPVTRIEANRNTDNSVGITAADLSPDGTVLAMKNRVQGFIWNVPVGTDPADALVAEPSAPCTADFGIGEALALARPDRWFSIREGLTPPVMTGTLSTP